MTNFVSSFKKEISRVARKELRVEIAFIRKTSAAHRAEIAELKLKVRALEQKVQSGNRPTSHARTDSTARSENTIAPRSREFDATAFAAHRMHLGLTQAQMAKVLEASPLSIYKWESGKVTPRVAQLERIKALRKLGKRAVIARLAQ